MREKRPPVIATWILEHLLFAAEDQALAGDLLEEFGQGRPSSWYWQQVFVAVAYAAARYLRTLFPGIAFAVLWTIPAPLWWLFVMHFMRHGHLLGRIMQLDWPYSGIGATTIPLGLLLVFAWTGLLVYASLYSLVTQSLHRWKVISSMVAGMFAFLVTLIGLAILVQGHRVAIQHPGYLNFITDPLQIKRLPFFFSLLVSIWVAMPRAKRRFTKTAL